MLEATSGVRRCELAGARQDLLDLDAGTLAIEVTWVVVADMVIESDGKTAQHVLALDRFTLAAPKAHMQRLDQEQRQVGPDHHDREGPLQLTWSSGTRWSSRPATAVIAVIYYTL